MRRWIAALLCMACMLFSWQSKAEGTYAGIPWDAEVMPYAPHEDAFLPDNAGYHDDSLDIRVETFRREETTIMAVYVTIVDPSQLRTALAAKYPSKRVTPVSNITQNVQAVLGINGDYFSYHNDGIVIRNGQVLRMRPNDGRDTLIIDDQGDFTILHPTTKEAFEAFEGNVIHAFCFGPGLVIDGQVLTEVDSVKLNCGKEKKTQRIAIGQLGPLSYLILTCEGPENEGSVGLTLLQMADLSRK